MKSLPISFIAAKNQRVHHRFMIAALTLISNIVFFPSSTFGFMNMLENNESDSQVKLVLARGCQQANNIGFNYFYMF